MKIRIWGTYSTAQTLYDGIKATFVAHAGWTLVETFVSTANYQLVYTSNILVWGQAIKIRIWTTWFWVYDSANVLQENATYTVFNFSVNWAVKLMVWDDFFIIASNALQAVIIWNIFEAWYAILPGADSLGVVCPASATPAWRAKWYTNTWVTSMCPCRLNCLNSATWIFAFKPNMIVEQSWTWVTTLLPVLSSLYWTGIDSYWYGWQVLAWILYQTAGVTANWNEPSSLGWEATIAWNIYKRINNTNNASSLTWDFIVKWQNLN